MMCALRTVVLVTLVALAGCTTQPETQNDEATPVAPEALVAPDTIGTAEPMVAKEGADGGTPSVAAHHAEPTSDGPTVDPIADSVAGAPRTVPHSGASAPGGDGASKASREVTLPAGTTLRLEMGTTISSGQSGVEDPVSATLQRPVIVNGTTAVPAGAAVTGHVTESTRSGRVKGLARVGVRFTTLRAGNDKYDIRTAPVTREARATKKEDAAKIGVGAGAGAIAGAIAGGKKGAAIGTAVGAGGGTAAVLATRGDEVSLPRGTVVTARLSEPVTIRVR